MSGTGVLPVKAVEVLCSGHAVSPIPTVSTISSRHVGWNGIVLESFNDVPACTIPEHEHPTHFLNLLTSGRIRSQWTIGGRTRSAEHGPGIVYILPAGTRDRMTWWGPQIGLWLSWNHAFSPGRWKKLLTSPMLN